MTPDDLLPLPEEIHITIRMIRIVIKAIYITLHLKIAQSAIQRKKVKYSFFGLFKGPNDNITYNTHTRKEYGLTKIGSNMHTYILGYSSQVYQAHLYLEQ